MHNSFISKMEFAQAYFPNVLPEVVRHKLMEHINARKKLVKELYKSGYRPTCRNFSPLQVELIISNLGNPFK